LALPVAAYNLIAIALGGFGQVGLAPHLTAALFETRSVAGDAWPVSISDLLLAAALVTMFVELVKAPPDRRIAVVNHALSIVLFVVCLAEMLVFAGFANSTFFLITLMVLLDVLAGFILGAYLRKPEREIRPRAPRG
jgi:CHASE2 domain-containing sensor protein